MFLNCFVRMNGCDAGFIGAAIGQSGRIATMKQQQRASGFQITDAPELRKAACGEIPNEFGFRWIPGIGKEDEILEVASPVYRDFQRAVLALRRNLEAENGAAGYIDVRFLKDVIDEVDEVRIQESDAGHGVEFQRHGNTSMMAAGKTKKCPPKRWANWLTKKRVGRILDQLNRPVECGSNQGPDSESDQMR